MAKKFVRGITDVKTITNQDYDTNNVNDLLSDGQYNYIHRKKGESEEYHNLTDNIKTISSDNTELLSVTNNNKTTNTATLHPKHDAQKEQLLESTRDTITINHGENGTAETTKIDVDTHKVLTHNNLVSSSPLLTVEHQDNTDITTLKATKLEENYNYIERQKQNTENYYICMEDVAGTVTLTKLENDIVLPTQTVKGVLEYSLYVCFDESNSQDYEKYIYGDIKNITDNSGGYGIYTDVSDPSLFSDPSLSPNIFHSNYTIGNNSSYYYENGGIRVTYNGDEFYMFANREKVPLGKIINLTGKTLLVEITEGGGESGGDTGGGGADPS